MTENQFIEILENALAKLPIDEKYDIIQDIQEYFKDGRMDGKSDDEIAASLGSPSQIAEELLANYRFEETSAAPTHSFETNSEVITIQNDTFTNVDVTAQFAAIGLFPSHSSETKIELVGANDKLKLTAEVVGSTLVVRLKSLRHWLFMFNINMKAVTLNVFIPKKLYDSIALKTDNGRITAEKMLGKKIDVKTDNGRIQLDEIAASTLTAETDNGRIDVNKVQGDHIRTKTDNGRIEMSHVEAESISAESDNGRIAFEHVDGHLIGITDNGRISLQTTSLDRNIDFKTDNGSITIKTLQEPKNVSIHAKTGHGRVDVFGEKNSRTVIGAGEHVIRLKSDNGRITVG